MKNRIPRKIKKRLNNDYHYALHVLTVRLSNDMLRSKIKHEMDRCLLFGLHPKPMDYLTNEVEVAFGSKVKFFDSSLKSATKKSDLITITLSKI